MKPSPIPSLIFRENTELEMLFRLVGFKLGVYMGVDIEIRRVGVIGMQLNFMAISTSLFYLAEIFCAH